MLAPAGISQPDPLGIGSFLMVVAVLALQQMAERQWAGLLTKLAGQAGQDVGYFKTRHGTVGTAR